MKRSLTTTLAIATSVLFSTSLHASLQSVTFTDKHSIAKDITIVDTNLGPINPVSNFEFNVIAGLDRRIRVEIFKGDNSVQTQTTGVVGINDRIETNGADYYGKAVAIASLEDGSYRAEVKTLDGSNQVVTENSYTFVVDTQGPSANNVVWSYAGKGWPYGALTISSPWAHPYYWTASGISDPSGLKEAKFIAGVNIESPGELVEWLPGEETLFKVTSVQRDYAIDGNDVYMYDAIPNEPELFPHDEAKYDIGFRVYDNAGNFTNVVTEVNVQMTRDYGYQIQIWNPNTEAWDAYSDGMTVHENPYRIRYEFPKEDTQNGGDLYGWEFTGDVQGESTYLYKNGTQPADSNYTHIETASGSKSINLYARDLNVVLGDNIELAPLITASPNYATDISNGEFVNSHYINSNKYGEKVPFNVVKTKGTVEARAYDQRVWFASLSGHCLVPAGETECTIDTNIPAQRTATKGYIPNRLAVCKTEHPTADVCLADSYGTIYGNYLLFRWDMLDSEISDITLSSSDATFVVTNNELTGSWDDHYYVDKLSKVIATDNNTGAVINVTSHNVLPFTLNKKRYDFDLSTLPEGNFTLTAYAEDMFDNITETVISNSYVKDNTAPVVTFFNEGEIIPSNSPQIRGLEGLSFTVGDANEFSIDSVSLKGGPISDHVLLAYRENGNNSYQLEYPRIFPSMEAGQSYTLEVSASDEQGNTNIASTSFNYLPANIIETADIHTLAVNTLLKNSANEPLSAIKLSDLKTDAQVLAHGPQDMVFTLRADSPYSVMVQNMTVSPGQTVELLVTANMGEIVIPIHPAESGIVGSAHYFAEIPVIKSTFSEVERPDPDGIGKMGTLTTIVD